MASKAIRQLPPTTINANFKQDPSQVFDAGAYRVVEVQIRRLKNGTTGGGSGGRLQVGHAASNEDEAFLALQGIEVETDATGTNNRYLTISNFLRFPQFRSDANVAGAPVFVSDFIAKE